MCSFTVKCLAFVLKLRDRITCSKFKIYAFSLPPRVVGLKSYQIIQPSTVNIKISSILIFKKHLSEIILLNIDLMCDFLYFIKN